MPLNFEEQFFGEKQQTEGVSPETVEIARAGDLTEDISRAAAVKTYTLGTGTATVSGNRTIINLFDNSSATKLMWRNSVQAEATTTLIFDLGKQAFVHNTHIYFGLDGAAGVVQNRFTTSYSKDNSSYTQIDTDEKLTTSEAPFEHALTATQYRYLKLVHITEDDGTPTSKDCSIYIVRLVR